MQFKVDDLITGIDNSIYGVTNKYSICRVIEIMSKGSMKVQVISHSQYKKYVNSTHTVHPKYFKLYEKKNKKGYLPIWF